MSLKAAAVSIGASIGRMVNPEVSSMLEQDRPATGAAAEESRGPAPTLAEYEQAAARAQAPARDAAAKRDALEAALASARDVLATATKAVDQARADFGDALAEQELRGGADPSRQLLAATEVAQRDAEARVRALERRRPAVERIWENARISLSHAVEAAARGRNAERQTAIDALAGERRALDAREAALFGAMRNDFAVIEGVVRERDDLRRKRAAAPAGAAE